MVTAAPEIIARNIGPIDQIALPVPPEGGVVEIRGGNGVGKSELIDAVSGLATGKTGATKRDGTLEGYVEGLGVTLRLRSKVSRSGELEVETLEGKLSVSDIVDPGLKSAEAADEKRIKALVALAGVLPDPALFHSLVGTPKEFEAIVSPSALESADLITMAARIKRDLEAKARAAEGLAENAQNRLEAARKQLEGVDLKAPDDARVLQAALEQAIRTEATLKSDADERIKKLQAAERARDQIDDERSGYEGQPIEEARAWKQQADERLTQAQAAVVEAKRILQEAEREQERAQSDVATKAAILDSAESHQKLLESLQQTVDAAKGVTLPSTAELQAAQETVEQARKAVETGALVRQAKAQLQAAEGLKLEAKQHAEQAVKLREAAKATDDILTAQVGKLNCPLRVKTVAEKTRLVLDTPRGETLFADLSHGERWKVALDIAIAAVGERGLIPLEQPAWEALDYEHQVQIAEQCKAAHVWLVTARASRKGEPREITAKAFEG